MCLILFAYKTHPQYPLVLAANRDEFYKRPTAQAQFWGDYPELLGGRDLEAMGTWFGITKTGRFAAITNYRDPSSEMSNAKSRGELVANFLKGKDNPEDYLNKLTDTHGNYNGFNLIIGNADSCWYYASTTNLLEEVNPGVHGLSNHLLDTPWPKVVKGKDKLSQCILKENGEVIQKNELFSILADSQRAGVEELPDTGVGLKWESILSSIFVKSSDYGTRASTILIIDNQHHVLFSERSFFPEEKATKEVTFEFDIN